MALGAHAGGRFLLRFEDLDLGRVRAGCAEQQARMLAWLGLDWDGEPVAQSARGGLYDAAIATLRERGVLYECFCSRADVRRAASAPHGPDGPIYAGTCRDARRARARPSGWRTAAPRPCACAWRARSTFTDDVLGPQREALERTSGDIVVRRSDGVVAYQLAVVVDDAAQGVTHVVRGADLLASTGRQLRLVRAARPRARARAMPTCRCCSATTASGSRSATARSASRSCGPAAPIRAPSSAGSRRAPACGAARAALHAGRSRSPASTRPCSARAPRAIQPAALRW